MPDLLDAVLARCEDIERVAKTSAGPGSRARWRVHDERTVVAHPEFVGIPVAAYVQVTPDGPIALNPADAAHIAMWHPAAALDVVAGVRELVRPHGAIAFDVPWCVACCEGDPTLWPCGAVRTAARILGLKAAS